MLRCWWTTIAVVKILASEVTKSKGTRWKDPWKMCELKKPSSLGGFQLLRPSISGLVFLETPMVYQDLTPSFIASTKMEIHFHMQKNSDAKFQGLYKVGPYYL